jgi:hypothetical protein
MDISKTQPTLTFLSRNEQGVVSRRDFKVHYKLSDNRLIEARAEGAGRGFLDMMAGSYEEKVAVIWGGIKHGGNRGSKDIEQVFDLLDAHQEAGGNWHTDIFTPCCAAALFSGLGGNVNEHRVARILQHVRQASGDDPETEPGGAIPAAQ